MAKMRICIQGALFGGVAIGLLEAIWILCAAGSVTEGWALIYAAVLYGLIGVAMGAGVGLSLSVAGRLWRRMNEGHVWTLGFFGAFVPLGVVISRYLANKFVYAEAGVPLVAMMVIVGFFGALFAVGMWCVPGAMVHSRGLKFSKTVKAYTGVLAVTAMVSLAVGRQ